MPFGGLALAGIFPFAGFFSKDEILLALKSASHSAAGQGWRWVYLLIYWVAIVTVLMTAFYTARAYFMTFWGPEKLPSPDDPEAPRTEPGSGHGDHEPHGAGQDETNGHGHDHVGEESPPVMTLPLLILAAGALLAGIVFGPTHLFEHHLQKTFGWELLGHGEHGSDLATALISTVGGLLGIGLAYWFYAAESPVPGQLATRFRPLYEASFNKFYVDEVYDWVVVKTTWALAGICEFLDIYLVDQLVIGIAKLPRKLGKDLLAGYQNGLIQFYAAVSALGVAVLLFILLLF